MLPSSSHKTNSFEDSDESSDDESIASPLLAPKRTQKQPRNPIRSYSAGLAIPIQQQLLQEIETSKGGLAEFSKKRYSLANLCNKKPDIYGNSSSDLRRTIQDKVKQWRELSEDDFDKLAKHLGVITYKQSIIAKDLSNNVCAPRKGLVQPRQEAAQPTITASTAPAPFRPTAPPARKSKHIRSCHNNKNTTDLEKNMDFGGNSYVINVDTDRPEANREVAIYELESIMGVGQQDGFRYKGYWICLPIDIRFIIDDQKTSHWKAKITADDTVCVSAPAWNYSYLHDRDEFLAKVDESTIDGMDAAHNDYVKEPADIKEARKWKHLYLKFPKGTMLTAKSIHLDAGEEEKLQLEMIPITVSHPSVGGSCTSWYAAWKVARLDVKARKKGRVEKNETKSDAAMLLDKIVGGVKGSSHTKRPVPDPMVSNAPEAVGSFSPGLVTSPSGDYYDPETGGDNDHLFDAIEATISNLQEDINEDIQEGNDLFDTEMGGENAHKKRSLKDVFRSTMAE